MILNGILNGMTSKGSSGLKLPSLSGLLTYGFNEAVAYGVDQKGETPDGFLGNALQVISPQYYTALKLSKGKSIFGKALALLMPERYAAYQLAKESGDRVSPVELLGVLFAPKVILATHAFRKKKPIYA